jgi:hypothetical protein
MGDAVIGALNPKLALPNTNITVVYRSDLSGSDSWPVTGASFILIGKSPPAGGNTAEVLRLFD